MSRNSLMMKRRALLKGLAAIPVIAITGYHRSTLAEMLSVDDPIAKNFKYTEVSPHPEQTCSNCKLYTGGTEPVGGCALFGNKQVVAGGWCTAWAPK
jgi:hypothetical protein